MIVGLGTDLVDVGRFRRVADRYGDHFLESLFSPAEIGWCRRRRRPWEHLAACFAAREAVLKALGTGLVGGMSWKDIELMPGEGPGTFGMELRRQVREAADRLHVRHVHVAITVRRELAAATVVLEQ
jgi:holo-[acyl-carrier protein] synthase